MASFIIRRLIASIFVLFAATFLMYLLVSFSGDPLEDLRQSNAPNKAELIEARTKLLNLDVIAPLRYFLWLGALLRGDFGISIQNQPVNALLANAMTSTLTLVTIATVVAIVLGIAVGIVSVVPAPPKKTSRWRCRAMVESTGGSSRLAQISSRSCSIRTTTMCSMVLIAAAW